MLESWIAISILDSLIMSLLHTFSSFKTKFPFFSAYHCRPGLPSLHCLRNPNALQRSSSSWRLALQRGCWKVLIFCCCWCCVRGALHLWRLVILLLSSGKDARVCLLFFLLHILLLCFKIFLCQGPKLCHCWAHMAWSRQQGVHLRGEVEMAQAKTFWWK